MSNYSQLETHIFNKLETELSASLYYHGLRHTKDVLNTVSVIAATEKVTERELALLKAAALLHDVGFTVQYKNHEEVGCVIARELLPNYGYAPEEVEIICAIIMATRVPQTPQTLLEEIICDADLDYLGRADFEPIARGLFEELKIYIGITDEKTWNTLQVNFLQKHQYFRPFGIQQREPFKQAHLAKIKQLLVENA